MSKVYFNPPLVPTSVHPLRVHMQEDTAGNRYYSEFEPGCTGPIRTWVERPELPLVTRHGEWYVTHWRVGGLA